LNPSVILPATCRTSKSFVSVTIKDVEGRDKPGNDESSN
jgi:hypothetical protein